MRKFWLVFANEYRQHVFRKRFLIIILSVPAALLVMLVIMIISVWMQVNNKPIGYIDLGPALIHPQPVPTTAQSAPLIKINAFNSEAAALSALQSNQIQAYYVLEKDYLQTGRARLVAMKPLSQFGEAAFVEFLRYNLASSQSPEVTGRIVDGTQITSRALEENREINSRNFLLILIPAMSGALLIFIINISGGYLLQAVVDEKENRTIEMLITSASPLQVMAGKAAADLSVGLTQLFIWGGAALGAAIWLVVRFKIPIFEQLGSQFLWLAVLTFLPALIMMSALMASVGAIAGEPREAQQIASLFTMPLILPYMFMIPIMAAPNSTLAVLLSLVPFTAPVVAPLRAAFVLLPLWQIILTITLLFACAAGSVWLAARTFRMGMLRYGKSITLREIIGLQPRQRSPRG